MDDQYSGKMLNELIRSVSKKSFPRRSRIGSKVVNVNGLEIRVGPEVIAAFQRMAADKEQSKASDKPPSVGVWQTKDPKEREQLRATAAAAGFPGLFDNLRD